MLLKDDKGNMIKSEVSKKGEKLYLYLKGAEYRRLIGEVILGVLYIKRDRETHLHYKSSSYGFNSELIHQLERDTVIEITEKGRKLRLRTTVGKILDKGEYLYFLTEGFERQIFLKLNLFESFLPEKKKRSCKFM